MLTSGMSMGICLALAATVKDKAGRFAAQLNIPETT